MWCSGYSTEWQTPYLTHEVSPYLRFSVPPSSLNLANNLLSSRPNFQPKPWTCFTIYDRTTRCHPPDLPQAWMVIYSPHAQDFSWSNNQSSDITGHSPIRPPTMNLFHNIRQKNKLSSQTYPNSEWLYAPLTPKDFSWSNKWLDVTRHSPVRPPTYPVTYLDPQVYHISNNNTALTRNRVPGFCPPGMRTGLVAVEFSRADHQATDTLKLQLFS